MTGPFLLSILVFLWPPYGIGNIFTLWFLSSSSSIFFSSPNLSGHRMYVYHTSTHHVVLVQIQNAGLKCAARGSMEMPNPKTHPKNRHLGTIAQLCQAISLQLRHVSTIRKKLVKQQYVLHSELRPTSG